ncbi:MAG: helix-turn-helix transcriptional regulator [Candidatus Thorarchaeota archaeon]|nr:helix-turn-helix transcriptional regulator [Candidatus Thorarchaeota archaeon]
MNSDSENVLKALSSSTRRTIMKQISDRGSATYTEIMQVLGLDPDLMSGTFNYHLKELIEAGLIERTNGEYRISDLGKRALILVDQVTKDAKIDRYNVLGAVMSMSPRKELQLFLGQMGMMIGFMLTIISLIPVLLTYGVWDLWSWLAIIAFSAALTVGLGSLVKVVSMVAKYKLGFSVLLFLSPNWFFIRSPNRNSFFIITGTTAVSVVSFLLLIILPYAGEIALYSPVWFGLLLFGALMTTITVGLVIHAKRRADRLEEMNSEQ